MAKKTYDLLFKLLLIGDSGVDDAFTTTFISTIGIDFKIKTHANEDVEKMILGNKCDMEDKRAVSKERGEAIAREHSIRFMETSAKANINIERAFNELASAILDKTAGRDPLEATDKVTVDKRNSEKSAVSRCC
ncbi:hypothetical protein B566_EDAN016267 [Ephemera danica]|nr:hypothetical protein B566_EDAN016267 [Ephemera danica]